MWNVIKMNFYRMARTKSTWILLACVVGFAMFATYVSSLDLKEQMKQAGVLQEGQGSSEQAGAKVGGEVKLGIQINAPVLDGPEMEPPYLLEYLCADMGSGILLIFISIFAVLFAHGEEKYGFIKNLAGKTKNRWNLYVAKCVAVFAFSAMCMFIYSGVKLLCGRVWLRDAALGLPILDRMAVYALIMFVLYGAFGCASVFAVTLSRSSAVSITVMILASAGLLALLLSYVNKILPWLRINLMEYQIVPNINRILYDSESKILLSALVVGLVYTVLYNLVGSILVEKRDVV